MIINQEIVVLTLILLGTLLYKLRKQTIIEKFNEKIEDNSDSDMIIQDIRDRNNQINLIKSSCPKLKENDLEKIKSNQNIPTDAILISCKGDWIKYNLASENTIIEGDNSVIVYFYNNNRGSIS